MNDIVPKSTQADMALLEQVVIGGDLSKLNPATRVAYYSQVCQSVGLNPLTKPFEYITLNGKLVLYAKRDATDQLRAIKGISIQIVARDLVGDIYVVTARATANGREDESTGAVPVAGLKAADLANAYMKAETKAKRRVTLSIAGLGMLDESEVADIDPTTASPTGPVVSMPKPEVSEPKAKEKSAAVHMEGCVTEAQVKILRRKMDDPKEEAALIAHFGVDAIEKIPAAKINEAIDFVSGNK